MNVFYAFSAVFIVYLCTFVCLPSSECRTAAKKKAAKPMRKTGQPASTKDISSDQELKSTVISHNTALYFKRKKSGIRI